MKSDIPELVEKIHVFLNLLNNRQSTVYFDDITLETINLSDYFPKLST